MDKAPEQSLTASHMIEYLFCPRFTYFENVLDIPQNEQNRFKVQKGRDVHDLSRKRNPDYLRKKIGAVKKKSDVYLSGLSGIRGVVDEILFLNDDTAAPLDYKYALYKEKIFNTYKFQLVFYAQLIKDNYNLPVNKGFIVYTRSKNKLVEVPICKHDYAELDKIIKNLKSIIFKCRYPEPTKYKKRCPDCCYRNICEKSI